MQFLSQELIALLEAGLRSVESMDILTSKLSKAESKKILDAVGSHLREGLSFSLTRYIIAMIRTAGQIANLISLRDRVRNCPALFRPNPSLPGTTGSGRLAPGKAQAFWTYKGNEGISEPQIVVGGDEAGKVWILRAQSSSDVNNWNYDVGLIFDLNQTYGANTTQTPIPSGPAAGRTKSTIGGIAVRYNKVGYAELYVPAYEAQDVRIFSYQYGGTANQLPCLREERLACPVAVRE